MQRIPGSTKTAVQLMDNQIMKLEEISSRFNISRSEALRLIVQAGLDTYSTYEAIGVVKLTEYAKRLKKAVERDIIPRLV